MKSSLIKFDKEMKQKSKTVECLKQGYIYYGTSGFRYQAEALPYISFRVGLFLTVYGQ